MASIATIVTRGYGSFGSVNLLPTLGYGIATAADLEAEVPYNQFDSAISYAPFDAAVSVNLFEAAL